MIFRLRPGAWLLVAGALLSCKSDRQDRPPESPAGSAGVGTPMTVTATDFAFDLPASIPAGAVTVRIVNQGKELHQAQLIRLEDGKTVEDFLAAMKEHGPVPAWVKFVGGPNGVVPGQETAATGSLSPGRHAVLCLIPSPDGIMHLNKGMVRSFEVTAQDAATADDLPEAGDTIKLTDYDFQPTRPLKAGRRTILVENEGPQAHELVLIKLNPGKTVQDFAVWAETGLKGPPPALALGGVAVLDQGGRGTFVAELTPGEYGFICFVPDTKDGKPHLAHGMMKQITVES